MRGDCAPSLLNKTAVLFRNQFEHKMWTFRPITSDILNWNFQTELFEIPVKTGWSTVHSIYYVLCNCNIMLQRMLVKYATANHIAWKQISWRTQRWNFHSNRSTFEEVIAKIQTGPDFMNHCIKTLISAKMCNLEWPCKQHLTFNWFF